MDSPEAIRVNRMKYMQYKYMYVNGKSEEPLKNSKTFRTPYLGRDLSRQGPPQ